MGMGRGVLRRTPEEWYRVTREMAEVANTWAGRNDLMMLIGDGATFGIAPALFDPEGLQIEVDRSIAFGSVPADSVGDFRKRSVQFDFPRAAGLLLHEALHARYSKYDIIAIREEFKGTHIPNLVEIFEETRIEALGVQLYPKNKVFLKAAAMELIVPDFIKATKSNKEKDQKFSLWSIVTVYCLINGRILIGTLERGDVIDITKAVDGYFGKPLVKKMNTILVRAQRHAAHGSGSYLVGCAKEFIELLKDFEDEKKDQQKNNSSTKDEDKTKEQRDQEDADEFFSQMTSDPAFAQEVLEALQDAASVSAEAGIAEQESEERTEAKLSMLKQERTIKDDAKEAADKVFSISRGSREMSGGTGSRVVQTRNPQPQERAAAVTIAHQLEKAKYHDRDETVVTTVVPPGRLRTRAALQGAAYKSRNVHNPAEPWSKTKRKHTDDPSLHLGVMVDISGSMGAAMEPMAVSAWVMSEAVRRIQGKCAMVYYGSSVFPVLKAGQHLPQVTVYSAPDGTEKFNDAFKALDGSLDLLYGSGARLLVIVSDGDYIPVERVKAREWLEQCDKNGTAVLWITFDAVPSKNLESTVKGTNVKVVSFNKEDVTLAARVIGKAAAKALTDASRR